MNLHATRRALRDDFIRIRRVANKKYKKSTTNASTCIHFGCFLFLPLIFFLSCVLAKLTRSAPLSGASRSMR